MSFTHEDVRAAKEVGVAIIAASIAAYVRGRHDPNPFGFWSFVARMAEAIVCGFLAIGLAGVMEWTDPRTTVGLAAAFGLLGTGVLGDLILKLAKRKAQ